MPEIRKYDVEQWITTIATGEFHYAKVCGLQTRLSPKDDQTLRVIMSRLCKAEVPIVERIGRRDGWYRPIQKLPDALDFAGTEEHKDFPMELPFDLRKHVFIYPDTTIIVAGSKSSGKTGFLYRTVWLNIRNMNTILLSNMEGGKDQMYDRFLAMGIDLKTEPKFVYPVNDNFHDFIKDKNTLYVIDYIDAPEGTDFYLIGAAVKKIDQKLQGLNSVAAIGLQKPATRDTAFGGEQTLKVATLYIAMDSGKLKIVDAKVSASKTVHPKNMQWTFKYDDEGTTFKDIKPFYGSQDY